MNHVSQKQVFKSKCPRKLKAVGPHPCNCRTEPCDVSTVQATALAVHSEKKGTETVPLGALFGCP